VGAALMILCGLFVAQVKASSAQTVAPRPQSGQPNTWAATSNTGLTVGGTWTATPVPKTGDVTGTWTLADARGRTVARGVWSAAKSPSGWTGAWRAAAGGARSEYSGTWSANADLRADAPVADLFAKALQAVVSGTWRAGGRSGAWSIRAFH
jgi:hypothetical protein